MSENLFVALTLFAIAAVVIVALSNGPGDPPAVA